MVMERERAAMGELLIAERMDPRSPEVRRHAARSVRREKYDEATRLLTQALEEGVVLGRFISSNRYLEEIRQFRGGGKPVAVL